MLSMYFFLIDVSMNAMQTGATAAACSAIRQVISDLPVSFMPICRILKLLIAPAYGKLETYFSPWFWSMSTFLSFYKNLCIGLASLATDILMILLFQEGPRTMVGIATFDTTIHFYNLKRSLQQVNI